MKYAELNPVFLRLIYYQARFKIPGIFAGKFRIGNGDIPGCAFKEFTDVIHIGHPESGRDIPIELPSFCRPEYKAGITGHCPIAEFGLLIREPDKRGVKCGIECVIIETKSGGQSQFVVQVDFITAVNACSTPGTAVWVAADHRADHPGTDIGSFTQGAHFVMHVFKTIKKLAFSK